MSSSVADYIKIARHEALDSLLCQWHQWGSVSRLGKGFNTKALVCGDYRISRQYDDVSGALDADLDDHTMRVIDFQVSEMQDPYRSAVYFLAKALTVGNSAFRSPRLPEDKIELNMVLDTARSQLTKRLVSVGVM